MDGIEPSVRVPPGPRPPATARLAIGLGRIATGNGALGVFGTISRHRRLSRWWLPFAGCLLRGRLPRRDTELVILRTAFNCSAWYEWVQHALLADRAGLGAGAVAAIPAGPDDRSWTTRQRILLRATDELLDRRLITDRTWADLAGELTAEECIELCFVVGHYEMLAMALNSLGVRPEPEAISRLDPRAALVASRMRTVLAQSRVGRSGALQAVNTE